MKPSTYTPQIVDQLVKGGIPAQEARLVADLATHAVNEAMATLARVLSAGDEFAQPLPFNLRGVAYGLAAGAFHALQADLMVQAEKNGLPITKTAATLKGSASA